MSVEFEDDFSGMLRRVVLYKLSTFRDIYRLQHPTP